MAGLASVSERMARLAVGLLTIGAARGSRTGTERPAPRHHRDQAARFCPHTVSRSRRRPLWPAKIRSQHHAARAFRWGWRDCRDRRAAWRGLRKFHAGGGQEASGRARQATADAASVALTGIGRLLSASLARSGA